MKFTIQTVSALIALVVYLVWNGQASARVISMTFGPESETQASGSGGAVTPLSPSSRGFLFKLEFGEWNNRPCFVRASWLVADDVDPNGTISRTFNQCSGAIRGVRELAVDRGATGYAAITSLRICNNGQSNQRLKGVEVISHARVMDALDDSIVAIADGPRFSRNNCLGNWLTVSSCSTGTVATGIDILSNGDQVTGLALRCSQPQARLNKIKSGDFTVYPIDFDDTHWAYLEGEHPYLHHDGPIDVVLCENDFPPGSTAEALAIESLRRVESIPNTLIDFDIRSEECEDERDTYESKNVGADIRIQITSYACAKKDEEWVELNATAGVCALKEGEQHPWQISRCDPWSDCKADAAILMLKKSGNYASADRVPPVGVIAHELGHLFGMVHNYWKYDECNIDPPTYPEDVYDLHDALAPLIGFPERRVYSTRPKLFHLLPGFTKGRGMDRGLIADTGVIDNPDLRKQNATAYSTAYFQYRFGRPFVETPLVQSEMAAAFESRPEWAIHTIAVERHRQCEMPPGITGVKPVSRLSAYSVYDISPKRLCLSLETGTITDCDTGKPPHFRVQFSSNSVANCNNQPARFVVTANGAPVYDAEIPGSSCKLAYYDWKGTVPILLNRRPNQTPEINLEFTVNHGRVTEEIVHDDNTLSMSIPLEVGR